MSSLSQTLSQVQTLRVRHCEIIMKGYISQKVNMAGQDCTG
jgi:hypothetical protein